MFYKIMIAIFLIASGVVFLCTSFGLSGAMLALVGFVAGVAGILAGIALAVNS